MHKTYVQQTFRSVHQTIISATEILNILVISISQVSQIRLYMLNRDFDKPTVLNRDFDKPTVLCSDSSKTRLFVKETLHIKDQFAHKSLNVNIKSYECKLF